MSGGSGIFPLIGDQRVAAAPGEQVWLSASAGTGKTQVLTARVYRLLLLPGLKPENILCLTFTKAGASEMANRINAQLAAWVRMGDIELALDLKHIGAATDPDTIGRARRLFARVLDAPNGGLRIQTIHSFCQSLLTGFPAEAGVIPGFRQMEDREGRQLARQVLGDMLVDAARQGDSRLTDSIGLLSTRLGPEDAERFLLRCAAYPEGMDALKGDIRPYVNAAIGLDRDELGQSVIEACRDDTPLLLDLAVLERANREWNGKNGVTYTDPMRQWFAFAPEQRAARIDMPLTAFLTGKGELRKPTKGLLAEWPDYPQSAEAAAQNLLELQAVQALVDFAGDYSRALEAGRDFAWRYAEAKRRAGLMDFDDLIRTTAALLTKGAMADWIRFKMDQQFDHILVDESQDTNSAQWDIVGALVDDFYTGEGSKPDTLRTLFTVGDFKQAIFGFQGTSPRNYRAAREHIGMLAQRGGKPFLNPALTANFRSSQIILDCVDTVMNHIGPEALGLDSNAALHHQGIDRPGLVELWRPTKGLESDAEDEEGQEDWLSRADRMFAHRLAERIARWTSGRAEDGGLWLEKRRGGAGAGWARPGDVLVLLQKRRDMAALIVARLHAANVAVAGIDRLRLGQPLGVKDLLSAIRFVLQPRDDLNLATLLVSPLMGWSQEELLEHGHRPAGVTLWRHLRDRAERNADVVERIAPLYDLLAAADFGTPYAFLQAILSGPLQGRARLVSRLGVEVLDPVDEMLNVALSFGREHGTSLQAFLHWFELGDEEIKRELAEAEGAVRVMTVHGSKGLQAPIVVLADACIDPENQTGNAIELPVADGKLVPVYSIAKAQRHGALGYACDLARAAEREEEWRLLYVAMTRAEQRLYIGGTLGKRETVPAKSSWYHAIETALTDAGHPWIESAEGPVLRVGSEPRSGEQVEDRPAAIAPPELPDWLLHPAAPEARPPQPLAPSSLGEDDAASPPALHGRSREAAERGTVIHSLFERLPEIPRVERREAGLRWLAGRPGIADELAGDLIDSVLAVLDQPEWAELFGPDSLPEAPVAAVVGEHVIAGKVDRLLIQPDRVLIVDFKTSRRPPATPDAIPLAHRRQMAGYAGALRVLFPDRRIEAALLYTETPTLFTLPTAWLASDKLD